MRPVAMTVLSPMVDLLQDSPSLIVPTEPVRLHGTVGEMICREFLPHQIPLKSSCP